MGVGAPVIGRDPVVPGSREDFGVAIVADHYARRRAEASGVTRVYHRLHIAPAMGSQES